LYPDVLPVLHELKRSGLRLAVISNWHRGLDLFCREMNLSGLMDVIIASADIGIEKPDSRIFSEAVRQLGIKPDRIVHIGDLPQDDFDGAVAAGFKAILMDRLNKYHTHANKIASFLELQRKLSVLE
jgi:putative hydrolase of the HAD superfamily